MKPKIQDIEYCVREWKYEVCMYPKKGEVDGQTVSFPFFVWQRGYTCTRRTFKSKFVGTVDRYNRLLTEDWEPVKLSESHEFDKGPTSDPTHIGQKPEGRGRDLLFMGIGSGIYQCPSNGPGKCKGAAWDEAGTRARWGRTR